MEFFWRFFLEEISTRIDTIVYDEDTHPRVGTRLDDPTSEPYQPPPQPVLRSFIATIVSTNTLSHPSRPCVLYSHLPVPPCSHHSSSSSATSSVLPFPSPTSGHRSMCASCWCTPYSHTRCKIGENIIPHTVIFSASHIVGFSLSDFSGVISIEQYWTASRFGVPCIESVQV